MAKKKTKKRVKKKAARKTQTVVAERTPIDPAKFKTLEDLEDSLSRVPVNSPVNPDMPMADLLIDADGYMPRFQRRGANRIDLWKNKFEKAIIVLGRERNTTPMKRLAALYYDDDKACIQIAKFMLPTLKSIEAKIEAENMFRLVIQSGTQRVLDTDNLDRLSEVDEEDEQSE